MQPTLRVVTPNPAEYRPAPGLTKRQARAADWPTRLARWRAYYETGEGYRQAVEIAHREAASNSFTRLAIQEAAQGVGWTTGKLLLAFAAEHRPIPIALAEWAARHVARHRAGQENA